MLRTAGSMKRKRRRVETYDERLDIFSEDCPHAGGITCVTLVQAWEYMRDEARCLQEIMNKAANLEGLKLLMRERAILRGRDCYNRVKAKFMEDIDEILAECKANLERMEKEDADDEEYATIDEDATERLANLVRRLSAKFDGYGEVFDEFPPIGSERAVESAWSLGQDSGIIHERLQRLGWTVEGIQAVEEKENVLCQ